MLREFVLFCLVIGWVEGQGGGFYPWDAPQGLCKRPITASQPVCCTNRQDECHRPSRGTLCYCDQFCRETHRTNPDCCEDYEDMCDPRPPTPAPQPILSCFYGGKYYAIDKTIKVNCNQCTCRLVSPTLPQMECERKPCLVQPETIDTVNRINHGWRAANYSFFWGKTLEEGYAQRAGICKPDAPVLRMKSVGTQWAAPTVDTFPDNFDSRTQWSRLIRGVSDQMDYPASWAISTVDVASDRLAIQTQGADVVQWSAQNLISCVGQRKRHGCSTPSTDRAWWYMCAYGVTTEECYPYRSGFNGLRQQCYATHDTWSDVSKCSPDARVREDRLYRSPPAYRVGSREEDIMAEIRANGPVQALMHVKSDFFSYRSGVYRHVTTHANEHGFNGHVHRYHAIRIIGWGVDRSETGRPIKYWLCANSWGRHWGEDGYFRIIRGTDESEIEMFVVGAWARKTSNRSNNQQSNHLY